MFIILIFLRRDDFDMLVSSSGNSLYRSLRDAQVAISVKNELKCMNSLLSIIQHLLAQYPTTLEQDEERLRGQEFAPFSNERHAVIQVRGEKEVLHFFRDFALTAVQLLHAADSETFDELLEKVRLTKHPVIYMHGKSTLSRLYQDELRRNELRRRKFDLSRPTVV